MKGIEGKRATYAHLTTSSNKMQFAKRFLVWRPYGASRDS